MQFNHKDLDQIAILARQQRGQRGMTLIEIMVVIVIIGVLGSALAYGVFGALGGAKEDVCRAQLAGMRGHIEAWEGKKGDFPASLQEMTEGKFPPLKLEQLKDPWKKTLQYQASEEGFSLCSGGSDKKLGTEDDICEKKGR